jgi:cation transport ATPase
MHPIARAIMDYAPYNEPIFKLESSQNRNGEGVAAMVRFREKSLRVYCGNIKLMDKFNVNLDVNQLRENMHSLE